MLEWLHSSSHTAQQGFIHCWIKPCRTWEQHLGRHSLLSCLNTDVTFLCLIWWRKRRMRTSGEVRISAQLQVYPKSSDGKQLNQFFLNHCPLNFEPTPPPFLFFSLWQVTARSTSVAAWWRAASREHLRRNSRRAAFHHRTPRHRCHTRHEGGGWSGGMSGRADGRGFGMVGQ